MSFVPDLLRKPLPWPASNHVVQTAFSLGAFHSEVSRALHLTVFIFDLFSLLERNMLVHHRHLPPGGDFAPSGSISLEECP